MKIKIWTIVMISILSVLVIVSVQVASYGGADSVSYFTFSNTSGACPTGSSPPCNGGTTGGIKSTGAASGYGVFVGFLTSTGTEYSVQWKYASGIVQLGCPDSDTIHGTVVAITGPSPVPLNAKITVVLNLFPSPTMQITSGKFTDTMSGTGFLWCAV